MGSEQRSVLQSESELKRLFELSHDLFASVGFDGYLKWFNPAFGEALGYSTEELLSRPFLEFLHPDDVQLTRDLLGGLFQGLDALEFENRIIRADGAVRWIEWNARSVPDEELVFGVGRDVTDRRQADAEFRALAEEQAALRRVATLVAQGANPDAVFAAVADEVSRVIGVPLAEMTRYDTDGMATVLASSGQLYPVGSRWPIEPPSVTAAVYQTGRAMRIDDYSQAHGAIADIAREAGYRWAVGVPIIVEGRLWGVMTTGSPDSETLPGQTEERLAKFTDLVATAIANAESRWELAASRARIVAAGDETRRRIERDLHDGIQQRLVSLTFQLRDVEAMLPDELEDVHAQLSRTGKGLTEVLEELRELSQGIHPAILSEGGLGPALKALARRSTVPVTLDVRIEGRLPEQVEVAAYYVACEALTNVAKHAQATAIELRVECRDGSLTLLIRDDGVGGADPDRGSGLIGLTDRVDAIGGTISVVSAAGQGTSLDVQIPVPP